MCIHVQFFTSYSNQMMRQNTSAQHTRTSVKFERTLSMNSLRWNMSIRITNVLVFLCIYGRN